jgi:ABC-type Zn uptake system ZnuABC Zn-binding protein ZnuA
MAHLIRSPRSIRLTVAIVLTIFSATGQAADESPSIVLTSNQATYSLAMALTRDTPIQVRNVPEDGRQMSVMADYIARRMEQLRPLFASATAVISVTNALPEDPIYRFVRDANIKVVNIDAAIPWSLNVAGVALTETPDSNVDWAADSDLVMNATAPYFWLSLANVIRMADIIAFDLGKLFPDAVDPIKRNLDDLKWTMLNLRNDFQNRLIESGSDTVFALTGDFVYLTNDMGLYIDGYFIKQDIRWTEADLNNLETHLRQNDIRAVIHKWMPSDAIQQAVRNAGATLVVLDTGDPGRAQDRKLIADGLQRILRNNMEAINSALGD